MPTPWRWSCEDRGVDYWTFYLFFSPTWSHKSGVGGGRNLHFLLFNIVFSPSWLMVAETGRLGPTEPRLCPYHLLKHSSSPDSANQWLPLRPESTNIETLFSLFCSNRNTAKMMSTEPPKHILLDLAIGCVYRELKIESCRTLSCWSPLKSDITICYLRQLWFKQLNLLESFSDILSENVNKKHQNIWNQCG